MVRNLLEDENVCRCPRREDVRDETGVSGWVRGPLELGEHIVRGHDQALGFVGGGMSSDRERLPAAFRGLKVVCGLRLGGRRAAMHTSVGDGNREVDDLRRALQSTRVKVELGPRHHAPRRGVPYHDGKPCDVPGDGGQQLRLFKQKAVGIRLNVRGLTDGHMRPIDMAWRPAQRATGLAAEARDGVRLSRAEDDGVVLPVDEGICNRQVDADSLEMCLGQEARNIGK